ncbi:uncharacterized protein LOC103177481 isoform X1 [Callorhinchus milii]|uniref:Interleukin-1 beta n=1 Tax=Callorhinchus milii TaxID=7868 RepID=A0A4W3I1C0_CALMI|nr:uncharacterized protein LOC103177481 isoform X1 [Callorhinchus milii]|eukprot:gi/632948885/ref/XP_007889843.1/ PREDICTED: uncharacterized protein LOC103177481 isoform X1 [Callorhinchus milii]
MAKITNSAKGGAVIHHSIVEGRHHYEFQGVTHYKNSACAALFRKGDCLLEVNENNASAFPPEDLAELLTDSSFLMTLHRPRDIVQPRDSDEPDENIYCPYDKRKIFLQFGYQMVRKAESLETPASPEGTSTFDETTRKFKGYTGPELPIIPQHNDRTSTDEEEQNGDSGGCDKTQGLLVALSHAAISVVQGRGPKRPQGKVCSICNKNDCELHTIHVRSEAKAEVYCVQETLAPKDCCEMIMKVVRSDCPYLIRNEYDQCLRPGNERKKIVLSRQDSDSAQMTVFYYKSNVIPNPFGGIPVVLNFLKTNCFLACHCEGNNVLLRIEECTSTSLKSIRKDSSYWHFMFYMKQQFDGSCSFESAKYRQWFINNQTTRRIAEMKRTVEKPLDVDFVFLLVKT